MAIMSMTGFGSGEHESDEFSYRCEVKSLNTRFLDVFTRLPRNLSALENGIVSKVKSKLARGKVEASFEIQSKTSGNLLPELDPKVLEHYVALAEKTKNYVVENLHLDPPRMPSVWDYFKMDGVLDNQNSKQISDIIELHGDGISSCLEAALESLITSRKSEGAALEVAMATLLDSIAKDRQSLRKISGEIQEQMYQAYTTRLNTLSEKLEDNRLKQAVSQIPEERILQEITILIDKSDIEEELTRLENHESEFKKIISKGYAVGRKLDFLCQEMHREVNTISSKLIQTESSKQTLNLKQSVERLRQQVQNIE